jgi:hypothetical protein
MTNYDRRDFTGEDDAAAQAFISNLARGDRLTVRFTARGSRLAEVTDATSRAVWIKTYAPKHDEWSKERKLTIHDLKW